jgi:CubicO group peptidase (beta-lactamase class C family)
VKADAPESHRNGPSIRFSNSVHNQSFTISCSPRQRTSSRDIIPRMPRGASFLLLSCLVLGIPTSGRIEAQSQPKPTPQLVTSDSPQTTPAGATFIVPAGWSTAREASSLILQAPEPDTRIAIVDVHAADATTAVTSAWATFRPDMKRPLKIAVPVPNRNGWTDGKQFIYETSPNERAVVVAVALHAGDTWTVAILDGSRSTVEKRGAQTSLIIQSLRPKGYQRESFAGRQANRLTPERIATLKTFVETSMKKLGVPGASLALLDKGEVVYEGGLGVRELGKPTAVDANTLFMAASNTKGLTTLLLARLIDAHKLRWDQTVTQVYPDFKLGDATTTRQVEIKHLICACTGLPRQDLEWIFEYKKFTPASTFTLLSNMQPTSRFGEVFQYSNIMASAAGYVAAHLSEPGRELGAGYDQAMQKQIFNPLGMHDATFDMERAQRGNFASPHADDIDGHPARATMDNNYSVVPFRPAGGVWTSAHDMTRYVLLELSRGKLPDGTQFVSEENLLMRRKPQIATGEDETYGMGLETNSRWGVPIVHHGGSLFGYKSDWMILPDSGIGAVLLTSSTANRKPLAIWTARPRITAHSCQRSGSASRCRPARMKPQSSPRSTQAMSSETSRLSTKVSTLFSPSMVGRAQSPRAKTMTAQSRSLRSTPLAAASNL